MKEFLDGILDRYFDVESVIFNIDIKWVNTVNNNTFLNRVGNYHIKVKNGIIERFLDYEHILYCSRFYPPDGAKRVKITYTPDNSYACGYKREIEYK
jgi:hypothetical protein